MISYELSTEIQTGMNTYVQGRRRSHAPHPKITSVNNEKPTGIYKRPNAICNDIDPKNNPLTMPCMNDENSRY